MSSLGYVPKAADLVWIDYSSQALDEYKQRILGFVVSPQAYNIKTGRVVICSVSGDQTGYPFEVALPKSCELTGVILSDHVSSINWHTYKLSLVTTLDQVTFEEVSSRLGALFDI
jgi:mRNA interferase MazF